MYNIIIVKLGRISNVVRQRGAGRVWRVKVGVPKVLQELNYIEAPSHGRGTFPSPVRLSSTDYHNVVLVHLPDRFSNTNDS